MHARQTRMWKLGEVGDVWTLDIRGPNLSRRGGAVGVQLSS